MDSSAAWQPDSAETLGSTNLSGCLSLLCRLPKRVQYITFHFPSGIHYSRCGKDMRKKRKTSNQLRSSTERAFVFVKFQRGLMINMVVSCHRVK